MLGPAETDRYGRMTVAERLRETALLMESDERALAAMTVEARAERLRLIEQRQAESALALLRGLAGA